MLGCTALVRNSGLLLSVPGAPYTVAAVSAAVMPAMRSVSLALMRVVCFMVLFLGIDGSGVYAFTSFVRSSCAI